MQTNLPRSAKTIMNLTTVISTTKFNLTYKLLAIASNEILDAANLIHFLRGTVFSKFPSINYILQQLLRQLPWRLNLLSLNREFY